MNFKVMPRPERDGARSCDFRFGAGAERARTGGDARSAAAGSPDLLIPRPPRRWTPPALRRCRPEATGRWWTVTERTGAAGGMMTILENARRRFLAPGGNFTPPLPAAQSGGRGGPYLCTLKEVAGVMEEAGGSVVAARGSGVVYPHLELWRRTLWWFLPWRAAGLENGHRFAPRRARQLRAVARAGATTWS